MRQYSGLFKALTPAYQLCFCQSYSIKTASVGQLHVVFEIVMYPLVVFGEGVSEFLARAQCLLDRIPDYHGKCSDLSLISVRFLGFVNLRGIVLLLFAGW